MLARTEDGAARQPDRLPTLLDGLPLGHFRSIVLDPPWFFRTRTNFVSKRDPRHHYKGGVMSASDIKALPIGALADPAGCHLFLWVTGPCLEQAFDVLRAWGFKYSGVAFTWVKLKASHDPKQLRILPSADGDFHVGLGFTTRKNCEFVLLARRGNARRVSKKVRELIIAPRREHSRKPEEARIRIEQYCEGPYLDVFSREAREGWTCVGDEVGKFAAAT